MQTDNPLFSVIVPVYNTGEYLIPCLESILGQTYQNLELLLVDDGSTDGSGAVCGRYAEKDPRVRAFHQENRGVGAARNYGMDQASGEYLAFVDADDYIAPDYLETFQRILAKEEDAQIIFCDLSKVKDGETRKMGLILRSRRITERDRLFQDLLNSPEQYGAGVAGACFSKNLIGKHRFSGLSYGEDGFFLMELFLNAPTVCLTEYAGYYYIQRSGSAMHRIGERPVLYAMDRLTLARWLFRHIGLFSPEVQSSILRRFADRLYSAFTSFAFESEEKRDASVHALLLSDLSDFWQARRRVPCDVGWLFLLKLRLLARFPSVFYRLRLLYHKLRRRR